MINTVVIPAAGLGTRLFTITKETPKEMVPVFYKTNDGKILLKPLLEIIFENLYDSGFRNFCFIVGRGKDAIENHLSPHYDFIELLKKKNENDYAKILSNLYKKIEKSSIVWIRQHSLKGIGPATILAKEYVGSKPFLFHAGDLYIPNTKYLKDIIDIHKKFKPVATIGLKKVKDPKRYGVANIKKNKNELKILNVVEKPEKPTTNNALTGVNIFEKEIFDAIKKTKPGKNNEIQLTDGIQTLIKNNHNVVGSLMNSKDICIDIGVPNTYFDAIKYSYTNIIKKSK
jgi:UTP--glucose-1-phosphate uridylyltransferase